MSKYYVAYGSNLNRKQMAIRCPDAKPIGTQILMDTELVFRSNTKGCGVATLERKKGSSVHVGIWEISDNDEKALDRYEGYPYLYTKKNIIFHMYGEKKKAMIYLMNEGHRKTEPALYYLNTIADGYMDFGFPLNELYKAANQSSPCT